MIINKANLVTLFRSYSALFQSAFAGADSSWAQVATLVPSSTEANLYAFLGQFPRLREWIGDRVIKNMATHDYTVTNKPFEATVSVGRDALDDDTYGVYGPLMEEMGFAAKTHPDELVYTLLASGASELCYDGQYFFDTDHPVIENGVAATKDNYDSAGGGDLWILMDTKRPIKPMLYQKRRDYAFKAFSNPNDEHVFMKNEYIFGTDGRGSAGFGLWQLAYGSLNTLNSTNFDAYVTKMMQLKSDEDNPLGIRPNLLVVGASNRAAARSLIETERLASGATNPNYKEVEILVVPWLD